jgi:hypothetical protein
VTRNTWIVAAGATGVLVVAFAALAFSSGLVPRGGTVVGLSPSPTLVLAPSTGGAAPISIPEGASPSPGETVRESAPVPTPPAPSTPTPTPDPAIWRFEGRVVDELDQPLKDVCVVIGPRGCRQVSPHTDDRGVYYFDVPQVPTVEYDLYFMKPGYVVVWAHVQPVAPTTFNVVLRKQR